MAENDPWESVQLQTWQDDPAAPTGVGQVAPEILANQQAAAAGQPLDPWASVDLTNSAQSWFGGRNVEGPENGWDTPFYREAIKQQDEWLRRAGEDGKASTYFQMFDPAVNKNATGIVTWNDPAKGLKAGDVFEDGVKTGNLVETYGERDAATMMAPLLFGAEEQARLFEQGDVGNSQPLIDAVNEQISFRSTQAEKAPTAEEYQELLAKYREEDGGTESAVGSAAAGAGATAAIGAGIGTMILPGVGTAIGAVGGALFGGIAGFLNRDQITEQVARTRTEVELADASESGYQGLIAGVSGWAGVATTAASPFQNTLQGLYDASSEGGMGDGVSAFYEVDETGARKVSGWLETANLAAAAGDMFAQFAGGPGRALFYATMGAQVGSGVAQLTTGDQFDPTAGRYRDMDGAGEWAAAVGSVGIDAVQFGVARALARSARGARQMEGQPLQNVVEGHILSRAVQRSQNAAGAVGEGVTRSIDRAWAIARGKTLPTNYTTQEMFGVRYFFEEGASSPAMYRLTAQLMAPSEWTRWMQVGFRSRARAAAAKGMPTANDVYVASIDAARSTSKMGAAVLNAFGEAKEEGAQAYLDPITYGESAEWGDVTRAAAMGFASGFGMSLGATLKAPAAQRIAQQQARRALEAMEGREYTAEEWAHIQATQSPEMLRAWAMADVKELQELGDASAEAAGLLEYETGSTTVVGRQAMKALSEAEAKEWNRSVPASGGTVVARPRTNLFTTLSRTGRLEDSAFAANEAVFSLWRVASVLKRKADAVELHARDAARRIEEAKAALAAAQEAGDADQVQRWTTEVAEIEADLRVIELSQQIQQDVAEQMARYQRFFINAQSAAERARIVGEVNTFLRSLGQGRNGDGTAPADDAQRDLNMRGVELVFGRHPYMDEGSFVRFVPQVSLAMSEMNQHGEIHLPQSAMKVLGLDYDGDFMQNLNVVYLPPSSLRAIRLGGQYFKPVDDGRSAFEVDVPDSEESDLNEFRQYYLDPTGREATLLDQEIGDMGSWVIARYGPVLGTEAVRQAWLEFHAQVRRGNKSARIQFIEKLINLDTERFIRMGEADGVPEAIRLAERFSFLWERAGMKIAAYNHVTLDYDPNLTPAAVAQQREFIREKPTLMAATAGAAMAIGLSQDGQRSAQQLNYLAVTRSAVKLQNAVDMGAVLTDVVQELAFGLAAISAPSSQSPLEEIEATDVVFSTVREQLLGAARQFRAEQGPDSPALADFTDTQLSMLIGSLAVPAHHFDDDGKFVMETGSISVLQMLLRQSVAQEAARLALRKESSQSPASRALQKARRLTEAGQKHSYTAFAAMREVYSAQTLSSLLGDSHALVGPDMTVDAFITSLTSKHEDIGRAKELERLTKASPLWESGIPDPPYDLDTLREGKITPYVLFANMTRAIVNNQDDNLARRNESATKDAIYVFSRLKAYVDAHTDEVAERIRAREGKAREVSHAEVLAELLSYDMTVGELIVKLMPIDSLRATFVRNPDTGQVVAAKWVNEALLQEGEGAAARAAKMFHVFSTFDHMRLLAKGGTNLSDEATEDEQLDEAGAAGTGIPFEKLSSRLEQTIFFAELEASRGNPWPKAELRRAMFQTNSTDEMYEMINASPMLRRDRAPLLAYFDDVADYEIRPTDLYRRTLPSASLRESFALVRDRLDVLVPQKQDEVLTRRADEQFMSDVRNRIEELGGTYTRTNNPETRGFTPKEPVDTWLRQVLQLTEERTKYLDGVGPTARLRAMEAVFEGLLDLADKGKGDPNLSLVGGTIPLLTSFGLHPGIDQETDNLTRFDHDDVISNLTKLFEGPVEVGVEGGAHTVIDVTTVHGLVDLLSNSATYNLAKVAMSPMAWDTGLSGSTQLYSLYDMNQGIESFVNDASGVNLFSNDYRPDGANAHRILSLVESRAMKSAESIPDPALRRSYTLRVQNMLHDFLVVYSVGPMQGPQGAKMRDKLVKDVAQALIEISQLDPADLRLAREKMIEEVTKRLAGTSLLDLYRKLPADLRTELDETVKDQLGTELDDRITQLEERLPLVTDPIQRSEIEAEIARLMPLRAPNASVEDMMIVDQRLLLSTLRAREMFAIDWTSEETAQASARRVVEFLSKGGRKLRFRQPKVTTLYNNLVRMEELYQKDGFITLETLGATDKTDKPAEEAMREQWDQISEWAARAYLQDIANPADPTIGSTANVEVEDNQYYSTTYDWLVEQLFDERLIAEMRDIAESVGFNKDNVLEINTKDVVERTVNNLFDSNQVGPWNRLIPSLATKARKALAVTPVEMAIPMHGVNPMTKADEVGASWASYEQPLLTAEHLSEHTITGAADVSVRSVLAATPEMLVKLENHFVSSIVITDSAGRIPADKQDALSSVGRLGLVSEEIERSPFRVMSLRRLQERIDMLREQYGIDDYTIEIQYVDVDKKPYERKWANNVFFEGLGRGYETSGIQSLVASLFFSTGAINKEGQQRPLEYSKKADSGFLAYIMGKRGRGDQIRSQATSVTEAMKKLALELMKHEYETGMLLTDDLPSVHKLMKMRHLVKRADSSGTVRLMTVDEAITFEQAELAEIAAGTRVAVSAYELIPLTAKQARSFWAGNTQTGLPGVYYGAPVLNPQDVDPFPQISEERLERIGLTELGTRVPVFSTVFAQIRPRPMVSQSRLDPLPTVSSPMSFLTRPDQTAEINARTSLNNFKTDKINESHISMLKGLFRRSRALTKALEGTSTIHALNPPGTRISEALVEASLIPESTATVVWKYDGSTGGRMNEGILTSHEMASNFGWDGNNALKVLWGDPVLIDVGSLLAKHGNNVQLAEEEAVKAMRALGPRGVKFGLVTSTGDGVTLINDLAAWLTEGGLPYQKISGSPHFFEPVTKELMRSATDRALQASLSEWRVFTGRGAQVALLSPDVQLTDGAGYANYDNMDHWASQVVGVFANHLSHVGPTGGREYTFGLAVNTESDINVVARLAEDLLPILEHPDAVKNLGLRDPAGIPRRRTVTSPDGVEIIEPGIVPAKEAIARLIELLKHSKQDLYTGRSLRAGDFIPYITTSGDVILHRYGFSIPKDAAIAKVLNNEPVNYPGSKRGVRIVVPEAKIEGLATIPPDFMVEQMFRTASGVRAIGRARLDKSMKGVLQVVGAKIGFTEMPPEFEPLLEPLSLMPENNLSINFVINEKSVLDKGGNQFIIDNFSDAFAFFGITFRQDLMDYFGLSWDQTKQVLRAWSRMGTEQGFDEHELRRMLELDSFGVAMKNEMAGIFGKEVGSRIDAMTAERKPGEPENPSRRIAEVVLATLLLPGVRLEHVLETSGLMNVNRLSSNEKILRMPRLMSIAFDDREKFPETFEVLRKRMNSRVAIGSNGRRVIELNPDWTVTYYTKLPGTEFQSPANPQGYGRKTGKLQYVIPVPAQQNVSTYEQRYVLQELANTSPHVAAVVSAALGGYIPDRPDLKEGKPRRSRTTQRWYEGTLFSAENEADPFDNLSSTSWFNLKDPAFDRWGALSYRELAELRDGRAARTQYLQPINEEHESWTADPMLRSSFEQLVREFKDILNLTDSVGSRLLVHQMIRMEMGIPGPSKDQDASVGFVTLTDAVDSLQAIMDNLRNHDMPTMGGSQVLLHADTYRMLFDLQNRPGVKTKWQPKKAESKSGQPQLAETWEEWIESAIGQALENGDPFEAMDEAALNGFWQTYQGVSSITGNLTVTFDTFRSVRLRSAKADGQIRDTLLITGDDTLLTPIITEKRAAGIDAMTGKSSRFGRGAGDVAESRTAYHARRRAAWRAKKKMTRQDPNQSIADYRRMGARYLENNNRQNVLFRNLSLWSLVNRMFNPGIYFSAFIEVPVRKSHEYFTNLVLGTSLGKTGELTSKLPNHAYTQEEVELLEDIIKQMDSGLLIAEIQNQVTYSVLGERSAKTKDLGTFSTKLEDFAGWMTRVMSDPWSGMSGETIIREYIGAAVAEIAKGGSAVTIRQLVDGLRHDPLWIKKNFPSTGLSPHKAGMNRVAQIRSMKPTMLSLPFTNAIQGLMRKPGAWSNVAGHLLHMQFMFVTFNANALVTLTGMSGWDQAIAMFFSGKPKPKFMRKGRALDQLTAEDRWDFTDVIETVDLQRTFIRSDITFSMLMALGMMAGNLGIDGDDEEARRRERLARYLNVPIINNPYEPQNNFRFANAVYLDSIPILNNIFRQENGESVVVPHWTIRQFTSPILGMQRFFDTGDLREIAYGFQDALSVIPNSVVRTFEQADVLADSLADQASNSSREETIEARAAVNQFAVNIVTAYEKVLLENQFVNTLYTASDRFDRDPYAIPRLNDLGVIERQEGTGLPLPTDATQAVRGADGSVETPYMKRTPGEATLYAYTENNLTAAVLASLFTGKFSESDYLRQNMVVKQRSVELPETTEREAEALILAAYQGAGGTFALDKDELIRLLKTNAEAAGQRWDQTAIENQADAIIASHSSPELAMSKWTEEYGEVLTEHGAQRLYESLWSGSVQLGHPSLRGIAIPIEMRNKVAANIIRDLTQDGVDAGLSYESAKYVARRIWYGDPNNPESPGMNQLLRSQEIPTSNRVAYNQLNVMYAIGPDGRPWATPFERATVMQAFGIPVPHQMTPAGPGTHIDKLGNVVDDVLGINTGISSVVRTPEPDIELEDPFDKLPKTMRAGGGSGGRRFGSGGGSSYFPPFIRMDDLPYGTSARNIGIPMINTSNPYIRRANVNRERVFGERGRLKQWQ